MTEIIRIGMDTSKHFFQLHGVDGDERPVLRKKFRRKEMLAFFAKAPPISIGIEACGASHYWGRTLAAMGHEVKIMPAQLVKPYVKRGKNDAADAEALCEAMSRPTMRFVPAKTADCQAALMLLSMRERLVRTRTQLCNAIRGHASEFGLIAPAGPDKIAALLAGIAADGALPTLARRLFEAHGEELRALEVRIAAVEADLAVTHRGNETSQRLARIPGIGPVSAMLLVLKAPDPHGFKSGRDFAAWIGLTPRDHSTAGKQRLGTITRAGDETLRSVLVVGATAVVQQVKRGRGSALGSLGGLVARKPPKLAAVALANTNARIAWKLMTSGESYDAGRRRARAHAAQPV